MVERGGSMRVLFHAFSMAGYGIFAAMLRDMAAPGCKPCVADVCGAVFDSAPQIAVPPPPPPATPTLEFPKRHAPAMLLA